MPESVPTTIEANYVANTVGPAIAKGLAEIILRKPTDPIEYLAHFLYKFADNKKFEERENEMKRKVEELLVEQEIERQRQEDMRRELEAIQAMEEKIRKEREAEEKKRREQEELARRKEEIANIPPALPAVQEEDIPFMIFGDNKLHECCGTPGFMDLALVIREMKEENCGLASRNAQFLTPREIAEQNNIQENVLQIDEYIHELVNEGSFKELEGLVINGFNNLQVVLKNHPGDGLEESEMKQLTDFIYVSIPQMEDVGKHILHSVEKNDASRLEQLLNDHHDFIAYRDHHGRTLLLIAIEKLNFDAALYLVGRNPVISNLNDCQGRYPIEYLQSIDKNSLSEEQQQQYDQLQVALQSS